MIQIANRESRITNRHRAPSSGRPEPAVPDTVEEVEDETDGEPYDESLPRHERELDHQVDAADDGTEWHPRYEWRTERTRTVGIGLPQHEHADGDEDEREQRSDVGELDHLVDVGDGGEHGDEDARDNRRDVRCPVPGMHPRGPGWVQSVAHHREEDSRLAELEDDEHGGGREHGASRDDPGRPVEP